MPLKLLKALFHLLVIAAVAAFCAGVVVVITLGRELPQLPDELEKLVLNTRTEFYSSTGKLIGTMGEKNRVPIGRISRHFTGGLLAAEDAEFYRHAGISKTGIARALWTNLSAGRIEGGASTITQQLARNFFFSLEQTTTRKLKEILLAFQLEYSFSKEAILEAYCNNMYFGSGAYGVEAASRTYFAKHADQLTPAEAALLVAVLKGPSYYNPYASPGRVRARQLWVLRRMEATGALTPQERLTAEGQELALRRYSEAESRSSYFLDYVKERIAARFGEEFLYYGGLKVYTTLDQQAQSAAVAAVQGSLERLDTQLGLEPYAGHAGDPKAVPRYPQGALVAVETGTGAMVAMVGGRDYQASQYNRAQAANRLPGSAFKPFVYLTAMRELGLSPAATVVDTPVTYQLPTGQSWSPRNFEQDFRGRMTLKKALQLSRNVISAQLIDLTGPELVAATARSFGITSPLMATPALSLGTSGVSPIEMASAYAVLAAGGVRHEPFAIRRIEDFRGNVLFDQIPRGEDVANPQLVYQVVDMMESVLEAGTGNVIRRMGFTQPAAGKTGTTSDYRDSWFVGFTPGLSAACWVGFDDNREMRINENGVRVGVTGARGGAPMWGMFMLQVGQGRPMQDFPMPPGIELVEVDAITGAPVAFAPAGAETFTVALQPEQLEALRQRAGVGPAGYSPLPIYDPLKY